tara:strand:+ start:191 stop:592 length:402 start_codon:yes stop_codon:yes gene_type:complete
MKIRLSNNPHNKLRAGVRPLDHHRYERAMHKMHFDKKSGDEITLEEVIENCVEELANFRLKFYVMGNDIQMAEDHSYKIQSFLDYVEDKMPANDSKIVEIANLCTQNLYASRQLHKALRTINQVEKFFDPVYG